MEGVSTLKLGHVWRVGDGKNINIWYDAWIPQSPSRLSVTRRGNQLLSKVADLIDPTTGQWDIQLVEQTFWPVDVSRILSIPLPSYDMPDFVAWNLTNWSFLG